MAKTSIKAAVRRAVQDDVRARKALVVPHHAGAKLSAVSKAFATSDSFVNFAHKLGVGADNALTSGTYGYNPITRNRQLLEWIYRGSWLGGVAVDIKADDMTRAGVEIKGEMQPSDQEELDVEVQRLGCWDGLNSALKWAGLYGGSIAVHLVDGQPLRTPLRIETVGPGQYKGIMALDRWMVEPDLSDLVTEFGPFLGSPKYYRVLDNAPALRGQVVHYTRLAGRFLGVELPYQQALTEQLWGISVLERLYDRMIAFDSASTGAAQLVFKSHLRTLKIPGLRDIVAAGGTPMQGLLAYTEVMRRFQGIEGLSLIDGEDEFDVQGLGSAVTGAVEIIRALGEQLAGALQMPLTKLFGQSPGAMSGGGESEDSNYDDGIQQKQRKDMSQGVNSMYRMAAQSAEITLPKNFALDFRSLKDLDPAQKAEIAGKTTELVTKAKDAGLVSDQTAMRELRQSSRYTGVWTNITEKDIKAADDQISPPIDREALDNLVAGGDPAQGLPGAPQPGAKPQGEGNPAPAKRRAVLEA